MPFLKLNNQLFRLEHMTRVNLDQSGSVLIDMLDGKTYGVDGPEAAALRAFFADEDAQDAAAPMDGPYWTIDLMEEAEPEKPAEKADCGPGAGGFKPFKEKIADVRREIEQAFADRGPTGGIVVAGMPVVISKSAPKLPAELKPETQPESKPATWRDRDPLL